MDYNSLNSLSLPVVNCVMLNYCVLIIHTLKMKMSKLLSSLKMSQTELRGGGGVLEATK